MPVENGNPRFARNHPQAGRRAVDENRILWTTPDAFAGNGGNAISGSMGIPWITWSAGVIVPMFRTGRADCPEGGASGGDESRPEGQNPGDPRCPQIRAGSPQRIGDG